MRVLRHLCSQMKISETAITFVFVCQAQEHPELIMNNLKVSTRLMLGFGMLTVIGLSIAILGALRMKTLANQLDEVATDRMVKVAQFTLLKDDLGAIVRRTQSIVIVDDKAFREDEKKKIAQLRVANDTILQKLEDAVA